MNELDVKASTLGRLLAYFQMAANKGTPVLVLEFQVEDIHRISGELLALLRKAEPGTSVHVDPSLPEAAVGLLSEYFDGRPTETPDTVPDNWE
jgi:hypothetical protein